MFVLWVGNLVFQAGFGNGFDDLPLTVGFGIVTLCSGESDDSLKRWVFELPMRAFLAIHTKASFPEVCDKLSYFAEHWIPRCWVFIPAERAG